MESGNACHSLCGPMLMGDLCIPPTSPPLPRGQSTFILDPETLLSGSVAVPGGVGIVGRRSRLTEGPSGWSSGGLGGQKDSDIQMEDVCAPEGARGFLVLDIQGLVLSMRSGRRTRLFLWTLDGEEHLTK